MSQTHILPCFLAFFFFFPNHTAGAKAELRLKAGWMRAGLLGEASQSHDLLPDWAVSGCNSQGLDPLPCANTLQRPLPACHPHLLAALLEKGLLLERAVQFLVDPKQRSLVSSLWLSFFEPDSIWRRWRVCYGGILWRHTCPDVRLLES